MDIKPFPRRWINSTVQLKVVSELSAFWHQLLVLYNFANPFVTFWPEKGPWQDRATITVVRWHSVRIDHFRADSQWTMLLFTTLQQSPTKMRTRLRMVQCNRVSWGCLILWLLYVDVLSAFIRFWQVQPICQKLLMILHSCTVMVQQVLFQFLLPRVGWHPRRWWTIVFPWRFLGSGFLHEKATVRNLLRGCRYFILCS